MREGAQKIMNDKPAAFAKLGWGHTTERSGEINSVAGSNAEGTLESSTQLGWRTAGTQRALQMAESASSLAKTHNALRRSDWITAGICTKGLGSPLPMRGVTAAARN